MDVTTDSDLTIAEVEAIESLCLLDVSHDEARRIVTAIANGAINNVTLNYGGHHLKRGMETGARLRRVL